MATVLDCARLAHAAYGEIPAPAGWKPVGEHHLATGGLYGAFQGMAFAQGDTVVITFKGTAPGSRSEAGDFGADFKLGWGMNTVQFDQANTYVTKVAKHIPMDAKVYLCGHSLGGAIAQIIGNRRRLPFVTFNAPGVGVIVGNVAEVATQSPSMRVVRSIGSVVSMVRHPVQALQDAKSLFYRVQGTNLRLSSDLVSMIGIHYGRVETLPYSGEKAHSIKTVIQQLKESAHKTGGVNLEGFTRR